MNTKTVKKTYELQTLPLAAYKPVVQNHSESQLKLRSNGLFYTL